MAQVTEILTGDVDGVNVTFTSSQIPEWGSLHVFVDGVEVSVTSFTETTITLAAAPASGIVFAVYNVKPDEETAFDLIKAALMEIGVASREDEPDIGDMNLALLYLNRLISSSNICQLAIFTSRTDNYTLTANQAAYTIGVDPAGILVPNFAATRPTKIKSIVCRIQSSPTIIRGEPMDELDDDQWAHLQVKEVYSVPTKFNYDKAYPLGTINFYPGPDAAYVIELETWQQGAKIANLYDPISYPPGYTDFWLYQLAVRLCGPFSRQPQQILMEMERRAIAKVESMNSESPLASTDPALVVGSSVGFNYMTGAYVRGG